ncbi:MAG: hypothetical protein NTY09_09375 [bacterium]|nr:hypothetical protein [bacterium]
MYRLMLVLCVSLMAVLTITAALYFYTLGFLQKGIWSESMNLSYFTPNFTLGTALFITYAGIKIMEEKCSVDDRIADNPNVIKVLSVLYVIAMIAMVLLARWTSSVIYGH